MTLFMIIISVLNIGVGYALAVYLAHGQLPWRVSGRQLNRTATAPISASAETVDVLADDVTPDTSEPSADIENESVEADPTEDADLDQPVDQPPSDESSEEEPSSLAAGDETDDSNPPPAEDPEHAEKIVTSEQVDATFERVSSELEEASTDSDTLEPDEIAVAGQSDDVDAAGSEVEPGEPDVAGDETEAVEPDAAKSESIDAGPTEAGDEQEELLRGLEQFQEQLQQQSSLPDQATPDSVTAEVNRAADDSEPAPSDGNQQTDLEGIAAFQAQMNAQTADTSEFDPVETPSDNAESDEVATSDGNSPAPLDGEKTLAGIEAFREQLTAMQDDSDATVSEEAPEEVAAEATT